MQDQLPASVLAARSHLSQAALFLRHRQRLGVLLSARYIAQKEKTFPQKHRQEAYHGATTSEGSLCAGRKR